MVELETLLRGAVAGAVVAIAIGFLRAPRPAARWAGALFCLSVAAFALNSGNVRELMLGGVRAPVWFLAIGGTAYLWMFAVVLFEDWPFDWRLFIPAGVMTTVGIAGAVVPSPAVGGVWVVHNLLEVVLVAHVALVAWRSRRGDLVEARRTLRGPFMLVVVAYSVVLSGFEIVETFAVLPAWLGLVQAGSLLALSAFGAATFLQPHRDLFQAPARPAAGDPAIAPRDRPALDRLNALMTDAEIWRREGLTVGQLAAEVGVPEHRLRRLINRGLGFRNFADYLNARRIEAAKSALADPVNARLPVSSLAFDLGYASLGPFNRAFKEATGKTPTEWRLDTLAASPSP